MINVHEFDGKLRGKYNKKYNVDNNTKIEEFNKLLLCIKKRKARIALVKIINDLKFGNDSSNYHKDNDINCSDLLYDILKHTNHTFLLPLIEEQLYDMENSGICDSGRVTRLFQIWKSLYC
jgi:hypothetical protein